MSNYPSSTTKAPPAQKPSKTRAQRRAERATKQAQRSAAQQAARRSQRESAPTHIHPSTNIIAQTARPYNVVGLLFAAGSTSKADYITPDTFSILSGKSINDDHKKEQLQQIILKCQEMQDDVARHPHTSQSGKSSTVISNITKSRQTKMREFIAEETVKSSLQELLAYFGAPALRKLVRAYPDGTFIYSIIRAELGIKPEPATIQAKTKSLPNRKIKRAKEWRLRLKIVNPNFKIAKPKMRRPIAQISPYERSIRALVQSRDNFLSMLGKRIRGIGNKIYVLSMIIQQSGRTKKFRPAAFKSQLKFLDLPSGKFQSRDTALANATALRDKAIMDFCEAIRDTKPASGHTMKSAVDAGISFDHIGLLPSDPYYYALLFAFPKYVPNWFNLNIPEFKKPRERLTRRKKELLELGDAPDFAAPPLAARHPIDSAAPQIKTGGKGDIDNLIAYLDSKPTQEKPKPIGAGTIAIGALQRVKASRADDIRRALTPVIATPPKDGYDAAGFKKVAQDPADAAMEDFKRRLLAEHAAKMAERGRQ